MRLKILSGIFFAIGFAGLIAFMVTMPKDMLYKESARKLEGKLVAKQYLSEDPNPHYVFQVEILKDYEYFAKGNICIVHNISPTALEKQKIGDFIDIAYDPITPNNFFLYDELPQGSKTIYWYWWVFLIVGAIVLFFDLVILQKKN